MLADSIIEKIRSKLKATELVKQYALKLARKVICALDAHTHVYIYCLHYMHIYIYVYTHRGDQEVPEAGGNTASGWATVLWRNTCQTVETVESPESCITRNHPKDVHCFCVGWPHIHREKGSHLSYISYKWLQAKRPWRAKTQAAKQRRKDGKRIRQSSKKSDRVPAEFGDLCPTNASRPSDRRHQRGVCFSNINASGYVPLLHISGQLPTSSFLVRVLGGNISNFSKEGGLLLTSSNNRKGGCTSWMLKAGSNQTLELLNGLKEPPHLFVLPSWEVRWNAARHDHRCIWPQGGAP